MYRIAICDDNNVLALKYQTMLEDIAEKNNISLEIKIFNSGIDLLNALVNDKDFIDIIFLDILMEYFNGVETAEKIRELRSNATIIFLTSSEEYIFDISGMNIMAYLMKDELTLERLNRILLQAIKKTDELKNDVMIFEKNDACYQILYRDICFIKIYNGYSYVHHWGGIIYENKRPIVMEELKEKGFFQVHPEYIVRLSYIDSIEKNKIILSDKSHNVIPLDKTCIESLKLAFADFMLNNLWEGK